jgi:hypothetical protein
MKKSELEEKMKDLFAEKKRINKMNFDYDDPRAYAAQEYTHKLNRKIDQLRYKLEGDY